MSWLFSRALVEEYSRQPYSGIEQSARLNLTHSAEAFCWRDKTMEACQLSRYGMTSAHLMGAHGEDLLDWYRAASRANSQAAPLEDVIPPSTSGRTCCGSYRKSGRDSSLPKTSDCHCSPSDKPATTSSASATGCAGPYKSLPPTAGPRTSAHAFGCLATPTATANQLAPSMAKHPGCRNLQAMVETTGLTLPTLYEWMMGWPIGWTELKPLATDRFHEWRQQHGGF